MEILAMDVTKGLVRLSEVTIFELRGEWRRLHRMPPPMRLSRDLLTRGISYKLQERAYGGLSMAAARRLEQAAAGPPSRGAAKHTPSVSLRPGTRLVREWHGVTHTALIHADGIEWRGQHYRSLSVVARKITGARWSGPRFFGLRRQLEGGGGRWRRMDRAPRTVRCRRCSPNEETTRAISHLFLFVGAGPNTDWIAQCDVALDEKGFVRTGEVGSEKRHALETNSSGVFAIGDVRSGSVRRVAAAVGEGAQVASALHAYLARRGSAATSAVEIARA